MSLRFLILVGLVAILAACGAGPSQDDEIDPQGLLEEAVANLQTTDSFALLVEQIGVPYRFDFQLGPDQPNIIATMSRANGGYLAPDNAYASARLNVAGVNVNVDIFAQGTQQWLKALGVNWVPFEFAPGFNPETLLQDDSGFEAALSRLDSLNFLGEERLFGQTTYHVRGEAAGEVISDLLFGLVEIVQDRVFIDVYIDTTERNPVYIVATIPDTADDDNGDTAWNIELFDFNEGAEVNTPDGVDL